MGLTEAGIESDHRRPNDDERLQYCGEKKRVLNRNSCTLKRGVEEVEMLRVRDIPMTCAATGPLPAQL